MRSEDERDTRIYNKAMQRNDHTMRTMVADDDLEDMPCDAVSLQGALRNKILNSYEYRFVVGHKCTDGQC